MNIKSLKEVLPYLFKSNVATLITGHHGVGKSQAIAQYCQETGHEFVDLRLGTQEVGDLLGLADFETQIVLESYVDESGNKRTREKEIKVATKFFQPNWFPTDPSSKGIIFLDEINRARRDVLQAVFQLVLDKRIHQYKLPKGWHVIGAMNPSTEDYIVTDISDKAFMDRFCHIKLSPSKAEFFDFAKKRGFKPELLNFLESNPKMLQGDLEDFSLSVTPSRRSWETVHRLMGQEVPMNLFRELCLGLVGTEATTALIKALHSDEKPITAKDVIKAYPKFKARVKKYSDSKTNQQASLRFTCDDLVREAQKTTENLDKNEIKNIQEFLLDIPKDLSFDACRNLYHESEIYREVINNSDKLIKIFQNYKDSAK